MISEEGTLYILLVILGVCIANLYGLRRIFILERKIMALEELITRKVVKPMAMKTKKRKR